MGKSASEKLWSIKIESGVPVLFKGGQTIPNFRNLIGTTDIEDVNSSPSCLSGYSAGASDTKCLINIRTERLSQLCAIV